MKHTYFGNIFEAIKLEALSWYVGDLLSGKTIQWKIYLRAKGLAVK